jgi:hypothetical protein
MKKSIIKLTLKCHVRTMIKIKSPRCLPLKPLFKEDCTFNLRLDKQAVRSVFALLKFFKWYKKNK